MQTLQLTDTIEPLHDASRTTTLMSALASRKRVAFAPEVEASGSGRKLSMLKSYKSGDLNSSYQSQRCPPTLNYATASMDAKNDATSQRGTSDKSIRPLPPIPNIPPLALATRHQMPNHSPRRIRPLPSVPSSSSPSDTSISTGSPDISHCSTPTTSLEDLQHPHPRPVRSLPTLPKLAPLVTNVKPPSFDCVDLNSPSFPMPHLTKRKRVEKFRRHPGEPIPDAVLYDHIVPRSANTSAQALQGSKISTYVKVAATVAKILELSSCDEEKDEDDSEYRGSSDASGEEGKEEKKYLATQQGYTWVFEKGTAVRAGNTRYSSKWVREKRGRRKTEQDYKRIIEALRVL